MKIPSLVSVLLLLLVSGLASCISVNREIPAERTVVAKTEFELWQALRIAVDLSDYPVGGGADSAKREILSGWKLDLAPYRGKGFRTRVIASYQPSEDASTQEPLEAFDVTIRVEKDINESYRSLDPAYADWKGAPDDLIAAKTIMQRLESLLGTGEIQSGN